MPLHSVRRQLWGKVPWAIVLLLVACRSSAPPYPERVQATVSLPTATVAATTPESEGQAQYLLELSTAQGLLATVPVQIIEPLDEHHRRWFDGQVLDRELPVTMTAAGALGIGKVLEESAPAGESQIPIQPGTVTMLRGKQGLYLWTREGFAAEHEPIGHVVGGMDQLAPLDQLQRPDGTLAEPLRARLRRR